LRVTGCCWDVTELRTAIDNLHRARSLLEAALEATADGLLVVDRKGSVSTYNQRFLSLWRIPPHIAQCHDHEKLLTYASDQLEDPEKFLASTREIYHHHDRESFDVQYLADGRVLERYSRPQRTSEGIVGRVWSFRDITAHEKLLRSALFLADA